MFKFLKNVDWVMLTLMSLIVTLLTFAIGGSLYLLIKGAFNL